jgi:hypothetical protein
MIPLWNIWEVFTITIALVENCIVSLGNEIVLKTGYKHVVKSNEKLHWKTIARGEWMKAVS